MKKFASSVLVDYIVKPTIAALVIKAAAKHLGVTGLAQLDTHMPPKS